MNQSTCALSAEPGECAWCTRDDALDEALYIIGLSPSNFVLAALVTGLVSFLAGMICGFVWFA